MSFYPDLGHDSVGEHRGGRGLVQGPGRRRPDHLDDEDHAEFGALASAYREHFGVPLIVTVRDIETRTGSSRPAGPGSPTRRARSMRCADRDRQDRRAPVRGPARRGQSGPRPRDPAVRQPGQLMAVPEGTVPEGLGLDSLNALPAPDAEQVLAACCASPRWVESVAARRP